MEHIFLESFRCLYNLIKRSTDNISFTIKQAISDTVSQSEWKSPVLYYFFVKTIVFESILVSFGRGTSPRTISSIPWMASTSLSRERQEVKWKVGAAATRYHKGWVRQESRDQTLWTVLWQRGQAQQVCHAHVRPHMSVTHLNKWGEAGATDACPTELNFFHHWTGVSRSCTAAHEHDPPE